MNRRIDTIQGDYAFEMNHRLFSQGIGIISSLLSGVAKTLRKSCNRLAGRRSGFRRFGSGNWTTNSAEVLEARQLLTDPISQLAADATTEAQTILNNFDTRMRAIFTSSGTGSYGLDSTIVADIQTRTNVAKNLIQSIDDSLMSALTNTTFTGTFGPGMVFFAAPGPGYFYVMGSNGYFWADTVNNTRGAYANITLNPTPAAGIAADSFMATINWYDGLQDYVSLTANREYRSIDGTMNDSWDVNYTQSGAAAPTLSGNRAFRSGAYSASGAISVVGTDVNYGYASLGYTTLSTSLSGSYMKMGSQEYLNGNVSSTFSDFAVLGAFQKNPGGLAARGGLSYVRDSDNWAAGSFGYADPTDPTLPTQTFGGIEASLRSASFIPWYWTCSVQYRNGTYFGQLPDLTLFPLSRTAQQVRMTLDFIDGSVWGGISGNINW